MVDKQVKKINYAYYLQAPSLGKVRANLLKLDIFL